MLSKPVPDFVPDFSVGEYGRHKWYGYHIFNNSNCLNNEMYMTVDYISLHLVYSHLTNE